MQVLLPGGSLMELCSELVIGYLTERLFDESACLKTLTSDEDDRS